jgi:hypothetical protein
MPNAPSPFGSCALPTSFRNGRIRIPTGFCPKAKGWEARPTLGTKFKKAFSTPKVLRQSSAIWAQPRWGCFEQGPKTQGRPAAVAVMMVSNFFIRFADRCRLYGACDKASRPWGAARFPEKSDTVLGVRFCSGRPCVQECCQSCLRMISLNCTFMGLPDRSCNPRMPLRSKWPSSRSISSEHFTPLIVRTICWPLATMW